MSAKASAQTVATATMKGRAEPVVLEPAVEDDLQRAEKGYHQHEADNIEPARLLLQPPALLRRGLRLVQDERNERHRE